MLCSAKPTLGCVLALILAACAGTSTHPQFVWHDVAIPQLRPGARIAFLQGDFATPGPLVFRLSLPPNYEFPAHYHDTDEELIVVDGSLYLGGMDGRAMSREAGMFHRAGAWHRLPAKTVHWAMTTDEPVIAEVRSTAPYAIHWLQDGAPDGKREQ